MTKLYRWAAFLLCLLPGVSWAQEIVVRTGEHPGFSRIVTAIPNGTEWSVTQTGRSAVFELSSPTARFDISGAFDLIPRDRIESLEARQNRLEITLACDCRIAPSTDQGRFAVLDVTSPGVARPVPFIDIQPTATQAERPALVEAPQALPPQPVRAQNDVFSLVQPRQPLAKDLPALAREPTTARDQQTLAEVQQRLTQELGTAATQGLVTPQSRTALPVISGAQIDTSVFEEDLADAQEPTGPTIAQPVLPASNLRITSSMDLPEVSTLPGQRQSLSGFSCPANSTVDLAGWSDGRPFHAQMAQERQALFGEFDRLNAGAAKNLAQLYLHFGFGAEARQALHLAPEVAQENAILLDIADIMETGFAAPDSVLRSLVDCESDIALWAILSYETFDIDESIDPAPSLLALSKLPQHLRVFLGPMLSRKLLAHGDTDAAAMAMRNVERLPLELNATAKLAQAELDFEEGDVTDGKAKLEDVIDDNAEQSPEALIALVETQMELNLPIKPETAGLIEAYAKELQETDIGPALRRAYVLALAKSGQFDRAFDESASLGGNEETEEAVTLRLQLVRELTATAGDVVFLDHVFKLSDRDMARLPPRPKMDLATRLLDLGFAGLSQQVLTTLPDRPINKTRQILAARIALELTQPMAAKAALAQVDGPVVAGLLAEANRMAGNFEAASELFLQTDQAADAAQAAWLADEPQLTQLADDPTFGPAVNLTQSAIEPSTEVNGMIGRSQAALEESEAARQVLQDLLIAPDLELSGFEDGS